MKLRSTPFVALWLFALVALIGCKSKTPQTSLNNDVNAIYKFKMKSIDGADVDLSTYKGKVLVMINVASECGYTKQYKEIEAFYKQYKGKGVEVLGFPANNFMGQEPGSEAEIKSFCEKNFGVTFPLFAKISVKGDDQHPLYKTLTGASGEEISWNFNKILISKDGKLIKHFSSKINADNPEFIAAVDGLLK